jgi:hypothetical protein
VTRDEKDITFIPTTITTTTSSSTTTALNMDNSICHNIYTNAVSTSSTDSTDTFSKLQKGSNDNKYDTTTTTIQPGTGWGIVDADGSEDGYGVVGLAAPLTTDSSVHNNSDDAMSPRVSMLNHNNDDGGLNNNNNSSSSSSHMNNIIDDAYDYDNNNYNNASNDLDILTDARQLEAYSIQQGSKRNIDMGPCHPGSKRLSSGDVLLESKVIMITASGSYKGLLSFNGKEVFFSSTFDVEDDKQKEDSAMVNLVKQRRMRRRRWVVSMML